MADLGIGSIVTAGTLCAEIFNRCRAARGEFRNLSAKVRMLEGIFVNIEAVYSGQSLTENERASLEAVVVPTLGLLRELADKLRRYKSLGTGSPSIYDQLRWAMEGGVGLRNDLDSCIHNLNVFNTSVLVARQLGVAAAKPQPPEQLHFKPSATARMTDFHLDPLLPPSESIDQQTLSDQHHSSPSSSSSPGAYIFGSHSVWDGVRFIVFFTLTITCVAFTLLIASFYFIAFIMFPFAEIPTGFKRCGAHWKRMNAFFGHLFNKNFGFVAGLWD